MIDEIRALVRTPSSDGIARAVMLLAAQGDIAPGERLPTIREMARSLRVSSSTVGEAWRTLAAHGVIDTQGRRGSFLRRATGQEPVRHFRHVSGVDAELDLSTGYPDPELLPDLRTFIQPLSGGSPYEGYPEVAVEPSLAALLRDLIPFRPQAIALATDVLVVIGELLPVLTRCGDRVVVGEAEFAPYLDLLERFGLEAVPVPYDNDGPELEAFDSAIRGGASLAFLQPRVHNPTGVVTSEARLDQLAAVCREADTRIVEIDHFGLLGSSAPMSAGSTAPLQTVHIRSFSKDLHPDLRICAFAGPGDVIERVQQRRIGGSWISRVNQRLLVRMLASADVHPLILRNKAIYDQRRDAFVNALMGHGVSSASRDGFNVWVPVLSEEAALVYLASRGISAAPGSAFQSLGCVTPHLRVSIAQLRVDHEQIAQIVANAAHTRRLGGHKPSL